MKNDICRIESQTTPRIDRVAPSLGLHIDCYLVRGRVVVSLDASACIRSDEYSHGPERRLVRLRPDNSAGDSVRSTLRLHPRRATKPARFNNLVLIDKKRELEASAREILDDIAGFDQL